MTNRCCTKFLFRLSSKSPSTLRYSTDSKELRLGVCMPLAVDLPTVFLTSVDQFKAAGASSNFGREKCVVSDLNHVKACRPHRATATFSSLYQKSTEHIKVNKASSLCNHILQTTNIATDGTAIELTRVSLNSDFASHYIKGVYFSKAMFID